MNRETSLNEQHIKEIQIDLEWFKGHYYHILQHDLLYHK